MQCRQAASLLEACVDTCVRLLKSAADMKGYRLGINRSHLVRRLESHRHRNDSAKMMFTLGLGFGRNANIRPLGSSA